MFAAPQELRAEVFARLPDALRVRNRSSRWADVQRGGAPTDSFLEGPSFDVSGRLYLVDIPWGRIFRVSPEGEIELFTEYDGEPNGLKIHRDGRIFVADFRRGLMVVDPQTRRVEPHLDESVQAGFKGLNDLHFALNGDLYFTDQGLTGLQDPSGRLYRLRSNGALDLLLDNVPSPNGLVLNLAENVLYLNVTRGNCIWRVPMAADGTPFKVGVFVQLSGGLGGPDGLAIDEEGNLAVAHFGLGTVWLFSALGEPLYRIRSPLGLATTNVAYRDRFLYITESETGTVLRVELRTPGNRMYSHT
jgi:gluconolactonase